MSCKSRVRYQCLKLNNFFIFVDIGLKFGRGIERSCRNKAEGGLYDFDNLDAFERQFVRKLCNNLEIVSLLYFHFQFEINKLCWGHLQRKVTASCTTHK